MKQPAFIGPSYTLPSVNVDCQRAVNLYPKINELGTGKNQEVAALLSVPGLRPVYSGTGAGSCRGMFKASNGRMFAVLGQILWELSSLGIPQNNRGAIPSGNTVSMADNGLQLCLVDGLHGYLLNFSSNSFSQITDSEFPLGASFVAFLDGYFIVNRGNSRQFQLSALYDGSSWDGLDVAAKEGHPDNLLALIVDHEDLVLLGSESGEFWFDSGDPDFPFARRLGANLDQGIAAVDSLLKLDNSLFWVSRDANGTGMVVRLNQYAPQRVSNFAVELAIKRAGDIAAATAWAYQMSGSSFYCLNLPDAKTTWTLDIASGLWHERVSLRPNGIEMRSRAERHLFTGSKHIVGDFQTDKLYELATDCYADGDRPLMRMRTAPHFSDEKRLEYLSFRLDMETGVGLTDKVTTLTIPGESGQQTFRVNVTAMNGPWPVRTMGTGGQNAGMDYISAPNLIDTGAVTLMPITVPVAPGNQVSIGYVSGLAGYHLSALYDSDGNLASAGPISSTPGFFCPATPIVHEGCCVGAWGDANNEVVGTPFNVGLLFNGTVPIGAVKLMLGFNDKTIWNDNVGSWIMDVTVVTGESTPDIVITERTQGADPTVMFDYSDDGGHSWSNEKRASAGKIGEYKRRVMFRRLGMARDRVLRVKVTDPVPVVLISSFLDVASEN